MIVFVNPRACGGRAREKWLSLDPVLRRRGRAYSTITLDGEKSLHAAITEALAVGEREFVAAGGDGTVNALVSNLMKCASPQEISEVAVGAIGLGSSNDFHKPLRRDSIAKGIPTRIEFNSAQYRDVGRVELKHGGTHDTRYFLVNASAGVTAGANLFFNHPDHVLQLLKRHSTSAAIFYAAVRTISTFTCQEVTLWSPETGTVRSLLTNVGVIKNPHFSGSLRYPGKADYESGKFTVHLCPGMNRAGLIRLLFALSSGSFDSVPGTRSWPTKALSITSATPFAVEHDGEVGLASSAVFSIIPRHLKVCP